jgi:hypothetical protein
MLTRRRPALALAAALTAAVLATGLGALSAISHPAAAAPAPRIVQAPAPAPAPTFDDGPEAES